MQTRKQETMNIINAGLSFLQKTISDFNFREKLKEIFEFFKSISVALIVAVLIR